MLQKEMEKIVKTSNREVYNEMSPEEYDQNESIFNEARQKYCKEVLKNCANIAGDENYLDIGTGTGNFLRISQDIFKKISAVDISENILLKIKEKFPNVNFVVADAENLPFVDNSFNCVSANALLHHLVSHEKLFCEIYRVLKPGGVLYTDHDPNYFFTRFYRPIYKIRFRKKHGFGTKKKDLAEYHNVFTSGINPEKLAKIMRKIGFSNVKIEYRLSDKSDWKGFAKFAFLSLKILNKLFPFKSLRTHFSINAKK